MSYKISSSQMSFILAIGQMQPCDIKLMMLGMEVGKKAYTTSSPQLKDLVERGLVKQYKGKKRCSTLEERIDAEARGLQVRTSGRRPWMYELTTKGQQIFHHLESVDHILKDSVEQLADELETSVITVERHLVTQS